MTEEPFLIAHKVRGEAAFDIAIQMFVEGYDEPWWIVATSGHRAYPYWDCKLDDLYSAPDKGTLAIREMIGSDVPPPDWPDHYQCDIDRDLEKLISREDVNKAFNLLESLGLAKKPTPIARRI